MILILSTGPSAVGVGATPSAAETTSAQAQAAPAQAKALAAAAAVGIAAPQFTLSATKARPGETVNASVKVAATGGTASKVLLRFAPKPAGVIVEPTCIPDDKAIGACALGDLGDAGTSVPLKVHIPKTMRSGTVVVRALAESADGGKISSTSPKIRVAEEPTQVASLGVSFSPTKSKATAGSDAKVTVKVKATEGIADNATLVLGSSPKATLSPACVPDENEHCILGDVNDLGRSVEVTIRVPATMGKDTLTFKAYADAANSTRTKTGEATIAVSPKSNTGGGSGGSGGSGGTGGSTGGSTGSGGTGTGGTGGSYTNPPTGLGSAPAGANPLLPGPNATGQQPLLPEVAPPAAPGTAPAPQNRSAKLQAGGPAAQEVAFNRLAGTQAAWLAALLVAFSLLLTHARMGKIRLAATQPVAKRGAKPDAKPGGTQAMAETAGTGGTHRRPRRHLFRRGKAG